MASSRLLLSLLLGDLLLLGAPARAASGDADELDVAWEAPSSCPAYADIKSWLEAVIPPDARASLSELHVRVSISGTPETGFAASVRVLRGAEATAAFAETRRVEGPSCEEVARSAIVVVSVAMSDALKAEAAEPPAPPPRASPSPVAAPVRVVTAAEPPRDAPAPPVGVASPWLLGAGIGLTSGFAQRPGMRIDASLLGPIGGAVRAGVHLHALPAVVIRRQEDVAKLHFVAPGAELCALPRVAALLRVGACARGELGLAWAQGTRRTDPSDVGAVAELGLTPTLAIGERLRVLVQADLELRLLRPRFETQSGDVLTTLPLFAGGGLVGLALALP